MDTYAEYDLLLTKMWTIRITSREADLSSFSAQDYVFVRGMLLYPLDLLGLRLVRGRNVSACLNHAQPKVTANKRRTLLRTRKRLVF